MTSTRDRFPGQAALRRMSDDDLLEACEEMYEANLRAPRGDESELRFRLDALNKEGARRGLIRWA